MTTRTGAIDDFVARLPFRPDKFQTEAFGIIAEGDSVIVTAPTSAGKTLVAEAAVAAAVATNRRAFYTTPIKALSNQKFSDLGRQYGTDQVGLLTGDNSINHDAPVIVMTTEVLRNMIYTDREDLSGVGVVILDEVHYLQDPSRGPVWEEIIIHLPLDIPIVGLSATVANAGEFTDWVNSRRGNTHLVLERTRPVPLNGQYFLFDKNTGHRLLPIFKQRDGRQTPNSQIVKLLRQDGGRRRRFHTPRRSETVEELAERDLLPAIYFVFSRMGCEAAAQQVAGSVRLTTSDEAEEIRLRAEAGTAHLGDDDLAMLGYDTWLANLERGVAPHHAGMVPAFKETVEDLFADGLVRVVFATETLALGINMPARSVVIENLSKFNGETHELLQPGDYTQLTGRAGRRGIDEEGVAVVLHSPYVPFERVVAIAGAGSHPLRSSFRPTYNMAVNLIANYPRHQAEELLRASFAQFQRSAETGSIKTGLEKKQHALADYRAKAACEHGDVFAFMDRLEGSGDKLPSAREVMRRFVGETNPGDVLEVPGRRGPEIFVMLARGRTQQPKLQLLSAFGRIKRVKAEDLPLGTARLGRIELPKPFRPNEVGFRDGVLAALKTAPLGGKREEAQAPVDDPLAACPDLHEHVRWAKRARKLDKELRRQERRLERLEGDLVRELEATLQLLDSFGYTDGWALTEKGRRLRTIYSELDLLVSEAAEGGLFDDLPAAEFVALVSLFVYEPRGDSESGEWPAGPIGERGREILDLWKGLVAAERDSRLTETRQPEWGFATIAHGWASGLTLDEIFGEDQLAAGDFVRTVRQLLDLIRQLRDTFPALSSVAADAVGLIDHGVVSAGGIV
ncbi:MAG: DEAD/DEAH box helicase [Acidimicrobiia bacterium]|nr:MAG: DEAD/DEAH box helicase [Acidimicrobiia bacterium]